jgi:hypothetical protein
MAETTSDILGKGFKYEQRVQVETIPQIITGTILAAVGGANWGPINMPTFIDPAVFERNFGIPLTRIDGADFSGMAMQYHLKYSPMGWFTRVSDGSDTAARLALTKAAQIAKISGNKVVSNQNFVITSTNNKLKIMLMDGAVESTKDVSLTLTPACAPAQSSEMAHDIQSARVDIANNLTVGSTIDFLIDDVQYRYIVKEENVTSLNEPDFLRLVVSNDADEVADAFGNIPSYYGITGDVAVAEITDVTCVADSSDSLDGTYFWLFTASKSYYVWYNTSGGSATDPNPTLPIGAPVTKVGIEIALTTGDTAAAVGNATQTAINAETDFNATDDDAGLVTITHVTAGAVMDAEDGDTLFTIEVTTPGTDATGAQWIDYTPIAGANNYAKRFALALRKYIVKPTLIALGRTDISEATITISTNKIVLNSAAQGFASKITVYQIPQAFATATPQVPIRSTSVNTTIADIMEDINDSLDPDAVVWIDAITNFLMVGTSGAGSGFGVKIDTVTNNAYALLGLTVGAYVYGTDIINNAGTFDAVFTGKDGDTIKIIVTKTADGETLGVYFKNNLISIFANYSYVKADPNFIGIQINTDASVSTVVTFSSPEELDVIPAFAAGTMQLSGGTSGIENLDDTLYNGALEEYKNLDLYQIDMIGVPGNVSDAVIAKLQDVCEYRQDCYAIFDIPEDKAGTVSVGGSIYNSNNWVNGVTRSEKIDSQFLSTYFPWVQISGQWYPPSVRMFGVVSNSDKIANNKTAAPAGPARGLITDIDGLAIYLREDEKNRLYADELGNSINPIVFSKNRGFYADGEKNTDRTFGAISRIHVLRTSLSIKKYMYSIAPDFFYEPLTKATMDELYEVINTKMKALYADKAIKEGWVIITDTSINTPAIEVQNGLIGMVEWTPVRSIEKMKIISVIKDMKLQNIIGI